MKPEIKAKWVAALRSGEYQQGVGRLREENQFCCLGVLCDLYQKEHPDADWLSLSRAARNTHLQVPSQLVTEWSEIHDYNPLVQIDGMARWLTSHNDDGRTFAEIADAIEAQL